MSGTGEELEGALTDEFEEARLKAAQAAEVERIEKLAKKSFDPRERLKNRGLRRATITLFTDDELGEKLGRNYERRNSLGVSTGFDRLGVLGELGELDEEKQKIERKLEAKPEATEKAKLNKALKELEARRAELEKRRDELVKELSKTGVTLKLRAVPPVIEKDCHRLAKRTCGITGKGVPDSAAEEVKEAELMHLLAAVGESLTDNLTGDTNDVFDYHDAVALRDYLSPGQWARLDQAVGELQFTDAISRTIEGQEDFS